MASAQWCISFSFRDAKGQSRKVTICFQAQNTTTTLVAESLAGQIASVQTALAALSNASVLSGSNFQGGGNTQYGVFYGTAAEYQSVSQQARLYYLAENSGGTMLGTGTVTIPAPKDSIFEADGVTINPSNTNVTALNTLLIASALPLTAATAGTTKSGLLFTSFVGGSLIGKKLSRKWNKYVKDPTLTIAGI